MVTDSFVPEGIFNPVAVSQPWDILFHFVNNPIVKTNKMAVRPAKTQISLGIRPVWPFIAVRMKKAWVLSYLLST